MSPKRRMTTSPTKPKSETGRTLVPAEVEGRRVLTGPWLVLAAGMLAFTAAYSILGAILYRYYLYSDLDLATFAQATDGIMHGRMFSSIRGMNWLGDHSSLILFAIAPIYALVPHPITLLVVQAAAQSLGALPVYALARREIGSTSLALALAAAYLLQPALGYANLFEFHPELLATAPLLAAFFELRRGRVGRTLLWTGIALSCREDVMLVVLVMALYAWTRSDPHRGRMAAALAAEALVSAFVTWGVLRPLLLSGQADYAQVYRQWGDSLGSALAHMLRDPVDVAIHLFSTPGVPSDTMVKQQFYLTLLLPLGLLPLASPITLVLALPVLIEHMLSFRVSQHTILCQYTALQVPFVSAAAVIGTRNLLVALSGAPRSSRPSRGRAPRSAAPARGLTNAAPGRRAVAITATWSIAAALGCQVWFGPLLSSGKFFITGTRGRHLPTPEERTLARYRDLLVPRVPPRGAVIASFELLNRFAARDSVHSLHHVVAGHYTFSQRPYPVPAAVSAVIGDLSAPNIPGNVTPGTAARLQELAAENRLEPAAAFGDLVLLLRGAPDTLALVMPGACSPEHSPLVFDGQLAFLGGALLDTVAEAGETVRLFTCWQRRDSLDRYFQTWFEVVSPSGRSVLQHRRDLGYLLWPPHVWPDQPMRESYRLILFDDVPPGDYHVVLKVRSRSGGAAVPAVPDDPARYSDERGIDLGRLRVMPRR